MDPPNSDDAHIDEAEMEGLIPDYDDGDDLGLELINQVMSGAVVGNGVTGNGSNAVGENGRTSVDPPMKRDDPPEDEGAELKRAYARALCGDGDITDEAFATMGHGRVGAGRGAAARTPSRAWVAWASSSFVGSYAKKGFDVVASLPRHDRSRWCIALVGFAFFAALIIDRKNGGALRTATGGSGPADVEIIERAKRKEKPPPLTLDELVVKYGEWTFYDGGADDRPKEPYLTVEAGGATLDVKGETFPDESWQVDAVYVNHFLDAAGKLITRAREAIYTSYGHGLPLDDRGMVARAKMFRWEEVDLSASSTTTDFLPEGWQNRGGWTTRRSMNGLQRRLTHAIVTRTNFTVVVATAGASGCGAAAAGRGHHRAQTYGMAFHAAMESIFERLGSNLVTRVVGIPSHGIAGGGDGVGDGIASAMLWSSVYGDDVDVVIYDDGEGYCSSSDTNDDDAIRKQKAKYFDFFARQALLSSPTHVPFLLGGDPTVLRTLHETANADVGGLGGGLSGIPETYDARQAEDELPDAARFVKCAAESEAEKKGVCRMDEVKFQSRCWVDRSDVTPSTEQDDVIAVHPDGGDGHDVPGWRMHRLKGYTLAFVILTELRQALDDWSEKTIFDGHPLADDMWHMGDYYEDVRTKVKALDADSSGGGNGNDCPGLMSDIGLPARLCSSPLRGRTEFTPRADPEHTGLRSIILGSYVPQIEEQMLYVGPDVTNPALEVPEGEVDVLKIINLGLDTNDENERRRNMRLRRRMRARTRRRAGANDAVRGAGTGEISPPPPQRWRNLEGDAIEPGRWVLVDALPGTCDGTSTGYCGRTSTDSCLLEGRQESRGRMLGNETSGWIVMNVPAVERGYVALGLDLEEAEGGAAPPALPDTFVLEYAVDGAIVSLDKSKFLEAWKRRTESLGMGMLTVLNDETVVDGTAVPKDHAVAVRVQGCGGECAVALTHVYWS